MSENFDTYESEWSDEERKTYNELLGMFEQSDLQGATYKTTAISLSIKEQNKLINECLLARDANDKEKEGALFEKIWASVIKWVSLIFWKHYSNDIIDDSSGNYYDQLMTRAFETIWEKLPAYQPERGAFSNYIYRDVLHCGIEERAEAKGRKANYEASSGKIAKAINMLKAEGRTPTTQLIHSVTRLPIKTIEEVLAQNEAYIGTIPIDSQDFLSEVISSDSTNLRGTNTYNMTPETLAVVRESAEKINHAINAQDEKTNRIIRLKYGFDGKSMSEDDIAKQLNITITEVRERYSAGLRDIKRIIQSDDFFKDRAVNKRISNVNKMLSFIPKDVDKSTLEDARSFMDDNGLFAI